MKKFLLSLVLSASIVTALKAGDRETTSSLATAGILAYFDKLVTANIITIENLNYLVNEREIVNPLSQEDAAASHAAFTHRETIREILAKDKSGLLNGARIKSWAQKKLNSFKNLRK